MSTIECPHCKKRITIDIKVQNNEIPNKGHIPVDIDQEIKKIRYYEELQRLNRMKRDIMNQLTSEKSENKKSKLRKELLEIRNQIQYIYSQ